MNVVIDIEANGLEDVTKIWLIVCKDIDTGELHTFREVSDNEESSRRYREFHSQVGHWIGHNLLGYDSLVLSNLLGVSFHPEDVTDTLIISKMADYSREGGHSIEQYGLEFDFPKGSFTDFSKYSQEMEEYCVRDVEICHRVYNKYIRFISNSSYADAILLEHQFQLVANDLHSNGFSFDSKRARALLVHVQKELDTLDQPIALAFPPKLKLIKEVHPKETKHGTLNRTDFRFVADGDLSPFNGGPFSRCEWVRFNPASPKQIIDVLSDARWSPVEKTKTRIELERTINRIKFSREGGSEVDLAALSGKLLILEKYGWKISEVNLDTLPDAAPPAAKLLAKRIMLESRRRTLTEWLSLVREDGRIHGNFYAIGAWTHRMAHRKPNTANIPTEAKLFGKEMRSLWVAPKGRLLVGVDAEGIQLRIFAHYINDPEFTNALVNGDKKDGTDPHSLNQRILGAKSRALAKRFIFAYLLGGGIGKLASILELSEDEGRRALDRLMDRYTGLVTLKETIIPADAKRGWFTGIDGRPVRIPGSTAGQRRHLCMSGYLQNGEAVVIKRFTVKSEPRIKLIDGSVRIVNLVHDEKIDECINDFQIALRIAKENADCLREVGEELGLRCPLTGSYRNEDINDYTIGTNWYQTH